MKMEFKLEGMDKIVGDMRKLGKVPQGAVTKSARAGGKIAYKAAKAEAPIDEGYLKQGLILKAEKRTKMGKRVFGIRFNPSMNSRFVKISKAGKRSYYPASQEWGFQHVFAGYIPGYRYLKRAIDDNKKSIEDAMLDVLGKELDKALRKKV
jgi:HK97 gp10 family phage protein